jgi:hypothetical protein
MIKMSTISRVDCLHVGMTVLKWAGQLPLTRREQVTCMMLLRMFFSECILNFYRAPPVTEACCLQKKCYTLRMGVCNFLLGSLLGRSRALWGRQLGLSVI